MASHHITGGPAPLNPEDMRRGPAPASSMWQMVRAALVRGVAHTVACTTASHVVQGDLAAALPAAPSSAGLEAAKTAFADNVGWSPLLGMQLGAHINNVGGSSVDPSLGAYAGTSTGFPGGSPSAVSYPSGADYPASLSSVDPRAAPRTGMGEGDSRSRGTFGGSAPSRLPASGMSAGGHAGQRRVAAVRGALRTLAAEDVGMSQASPLGGAPLVQPLFGDLESYGAPTGPAPGWSAEMSASQAVGGLVHDSAYPTESTGAPYGSVAGGYEMGSGPMPGREQMEHTFGRAPGEFMDDGYARSAGPTMFGGAPPREHFYGSGTGRSPGMYGGRSVPPLAPGGGRYQGYPSGGRGGYGSVAQAPAGGHSGRQPYPPAGYGSNVEDRRDFVDGAYPEYGGMSGGPAHGSGPTRSASDSRYSPYQRAAFNADGGSDTRSHPRPFYSPMMPSGGQLRGSGAGGKLFAGPMGPEHGLRRAPGHGTGQASYGTGASPSQSVRDDSVRASETRAYREHQWQLLRVLLLRRLAGLTHRAEHQDMTPQNLRAAMILFGVPTTVLDLVSRPHAPRNTGTSPHMSRREPIPEPLTPGDDVDLCIPSDVIITEADLARLPTAGLPEEALGWWPEGGIPLDGAHATAQRAAGGSDADRASASDAADVGPEKEDASDTQQQLMAAATIAAMAAELVARRRFKTKLCHAWLRSGGHCPRGSNCDYAHGAEELRQVGEPRDGRYKSKLCRSFLDSLGTFCSHGERCSFAHGVHELRIRVPESAEEVEDAMASMAAEASADNATERGSASAGGASSVTGGSPLSVGASLRRFKPMLCREWLQGAADAAAVAAAKLAVGGNPASLRIDPARAGARRCRRGAMCPHAHGLSELRLPSVLEQVKLIQALACESPHAAAGVSGAERSDHPVALRDQTLLLVASGLLTPCLPPPLLHRLSSAAALMGRTPVIPSSGILPDFEGMPPAIGKALTAAIHNPMLQVVLPYANPSSSPSWGYVDTSSPGGAPRMGLAKIIATVGNDAADAALVTAAVAMGAVRLPAHLVSPVPPSPEQVGEDAADPHVSMATGRYGALMRRRMELQSHAAAVSGSPPTHSSA